MCSLTRNRLSHTNWARQLASVSPSIFFYLIIMSFEFTDTPQIEEMMYWNDESIEQFLDEQGDIIGMNIECNELDTNMTV